MNKYNHCFREERKRENEEKQFGDQPQPAHTFICRAHA